MGMLNITKQDVLRSKSIAAGWYTILITGYKQEADKDGAALHKYDGIVVDGPSKDHPFSTQFSEKAPGFAINFINACAGKNIVGEEGAVIDMNDCVQKTVKAKNEPKLYNGKTQNNWVDYMPNV